jgi:hypothetical protein
LAQKLQRPVPITQEGQPGILPIEGLVEVVQVLAAHPEQRV